MITREEIKQKISDLSVEVSDAINAGVTNGNLPAYQKSIERLKSKANKQIEFYNKCILYLESKPTDEFIAKQIRSVENVIKVIDREFDYHLDNCKNQEQFIKNRSNFYKDRGIQKLNEQLKYLNFLLNK
jgi:hypothetical protein